MSWLLQLVSAFEEINLPDNDVRNNLNTLDVANQRLTGSESAAGCQKIVKQDDF